jgi:hypothetical protein
MGFPCPARLHVAGETGLASAMRPNRHNNERERHRHLALRGGFLSARTHHSLPAATAMQGVAEHALDRQQPLSHRKMETVCSPGGT